MQRHLKTTVEAEKLTRKFIMKKSCEVLKGGTEICNFFHNLHLKNSLFFGGLFFFCNFYLMYFLLNLFIKFSSK